jgi:hypothetical protein
VQKKIASKSKSKYDGKPKQYQPFASMSGKTAVPDLEVHMALTVILAVGLDPLPGLAQHESWKSAGYIVISVATIKKAIDHFKAGDFDLVLLGDAISLESKERLTFLIRSFGSQTPVICIGNSSGNFDSFADATLNSDSCEFLKGIEEFLVKKANLLAQQTISARKNDLIGCDTTLDKTQLHHEFSMELTK